MKRYGMNKATEFTAKQISVIYGKAKRGELKVEKWYMKNLYDLADYYGYDYNGSVEFAERYVLNILDKVFNGDLVEAQKLIDLHQEQEFMCLSAKYKEKADKQLVA